MESVIHKMREAEKDFGPAEKKIANYLFENPGDIIGLSISDLAKKCGCGDATVVRFSRRMGFGGYQSMKIGIAQEINSASKISREIAKTDTCFEIYKKRIVDISISLENTETVLDAESLENAAKSIMHAERIAIFGLGNSAAIANDAAHKFMRLGLNAQACCDNHLQAIVASHLNRNCVAVGISHSGSSKDIVEAMRLSKIGSAKTICVTNYGASPICDVSDIVLYTKSEETQHSILAMSSRIAQLAIFDAIYSYIVVNADKAAKQAIYNTEIALQNKKY